jgi:hypothetical protein
MQFLVLISCCYSYLFSDEQGDRPRPLPEIEELKIATDIFDRKLPPSWDFKVSIQSTSVLYIL